jgi:fluoroacetyl-CoA thioesterase
MKPDFRTGLTHTQRVAVDRDRTIGFMGDAMRVYSTPSMVSDIERTCKDFLAQYLTDEQNSVGMRVEIDHLGPALLDTWVDINITVTEVDRRKITFQAEVRDALDVIGKAAHIRFVVELAKQRERLEAKKAKLAQLRK